MANVIMVLGQTGTGKSAAIRNLNPDETIILNVLNKPLPFKGSKGMYNKEKRNIFHVESATDVQRYLANIDKKNEACHNVIIDDATFLMRNEFFAKASEKGYEKYTELACHFQGVVRQCVGMRDDMNVFLVMHSDEKVSEGSIDGYKCATVGKMLDEKYDPIACVTICLFSDIQFDAKQNPTYGMYTNATLVNGKRVPAKSPDGMFDELFIPNDYQLVVDKIKEYGL